MLALTCVGIVQVTNAPTAAACSCRPPTFEALVDGSDLIADVRVLSAKVSNTDRNTAEYQVALLKVWKGEQSPTVTVRSALQPTACGLGPRQSGEELRLWGYRRADDGYGASVCHQPTIPADQVDAALMARFGEPWRPKTVATRNGTDSLPRLVVGLVVTLTLLFLVR